MLITNLPLLVEPYLIVSTSTLFRVAIEVLLFTIAAASFIFMSPRESMAYETVEQARSRGTVQVTLVFVVGAIIGIIALPIIFISDIVKIVKNPEHY